MKQIIVFIYVFLLSLFAHAQIKGRVTDSLTREAVAGVTISYVSLEGNVIILGNSGAKGAFNINPPSANGSLKFSMVGFYSETIDILQIATSNLLVINLKRALVDLQPVVVSASREKQSRQSIPAAISKISSAQIEDTKATAPYQLLNKVAGVYMVNLGNEQHTMAIRQPITYNALYLYMEDGIPIRPTGIFNHNSLYEINLSGVSDIEVIKGPASSLYGSNSIGGAINFISQNPPAEGYKSDVSVQGDTYHYQRVDARGGYNSGKFGLYVGGYLARQNNSWQDYTNFDKYSGTVKGVYSFNDHTKLTTSASYNYLNTQTPGSLDSAHFYNRSYSSNQRFTYRKVNAFRISSKLEHNWNENNNTFVTLFFRNNDTGQLPSYYISDVHNSSGQYVSSNGQVNDQRFHSFGLLAQHRTDFNFLHSRLIAGVYVDDSPSSFYAQSLSIQKDVANNYYTGFNNTGVYIDDYRIKLLNYAAYTQYELKPADALRIVMGLRYDHVHYNFGNNLPVSNTKYKQQETNNYNVVAPKLGLTYNLGHNNGVYANYSVGFQPPETSSLYSSRQLSPLKQANFNNYELGGWVWLFNYKIYAEASLYDLEGHNEIITQYLQDNTTQNLNAGATRHQGIEYSITYLPVKQLVVRFNGTNARHIYLDYSEVRTNYATNTSYNLVYNGNQMSNAPGWIANTELTYKPTFIPGFRIAYEWQHLDKYYTDPANTKTYPGFNIYNLRLGYELKHNGVGLWLNVINLTNKLYATTVTSNQYGDTYVAASPRTFTLGLSYYISKH